MTLPGNVWVDLWADSGPIPVMGFSNRRFIHCFFPGIKKEIKTR